MGTSRLSGIRKLHALLQQAAEPMFGLDGRRRLIYVNRAWEELTGRAAETVLGQECQPSGGPGHEGAMGWLSSFGPPPETLQGQPAGGPALIVHQNGERRWRRIEFWPWRDEQGRMLGVVGIVRERDAVAQAPDSVTQRLWAELEEVRERLRLRYGCDTILGQGAAHRRLLDQLAAAAATRVPVLIVGESGTGRRLAARTIHQLGPRRSDPADSLRLRGPAAGDPRARAVRRPAPDREPRPLPAPAHAPRRGQSPVDRGLGPAARPASATGRRSTDRSGSSPPRPLILSRRAVETVSGPSCSTRSRRSSSGSARSASGSTRSHCSLSTCWSASTSGPSGGGPGSTPRRSRCWPPTTGRATSVS